MQDLLHPHASDAAPANPVDAHLRLHFFRLLGRLLTTLDYAVSQGHLAALAESLPFLEGYRAVLRDAFPGRPPVREQDALWSRQIAKLETWYGATLPLCALVEALDIPREGVDVLIAAGIVEDDVRFGALYAALQDPLPARRPCVGMLGWLLGEAGGLASDVWPVVRDLIDHGLLVVDNPADPRAEWQLRVPPVLWDALRGHPAPAPAPGVTWQRASEFPALDDLVLLEEIVEQLRRVPELIQRGQVRALVLRGLAGVGRRTLIGAVARTLGADILLCEPDALTDAVRPLIGPLALLTGAIPVLRCEPGPGETVDLPRLSGYRGPVGITLGHPGGLRGELAEHALALTIPPPGPDARRQLWLRQPVAVRPPDLDLIVGQFVLPAGVIERAAALGATYAALEGRETLCPPDIQRAMRAINRQQLDTLATPLEPVRGWGDLVVDESVQRELLALEVRCRQRESLQDAAGAAFMHTLNRGVRALLSGPSGTGKTLAARVLAVELGKDVYRVDLAAVVNKYIGETERNLNQVFAHAEALDVILLLDEGDALMARRTEVSNANDRYANLETNYLLQRLESYQGIVLVTTNAAQNIDGAFLRRFDVVVTFAAPEAAARRRLWDLHLPAEHVLDPDWLETIAVRCSLTGGQIRNAALFATLLALDDGQLVSDAHLATALQREYRKAGAPYPLRGEADPPDQLGRLRRHAPRRSDE